MILSCFGWVGGTFALLVEYGMLCVTDCSLVQSLRDEGEEEQVVMSACQLWQPEPTKENAEENI